MCMDRKFLLLNMRQIWFEFQQEVTLGWGGGVEGWMSRLSEHLIAKKHPAWQGSIFTAILNSRYGPHEKSWKIGWGLLDLKSRPSPHCWVEDTPGKARLFLLDQSEFSQGRELLWKLHRWILTAIYSAHRDSRLFVQTFRPSFVVILRITTNDPSLESLKSQQNEDALFIPTSPGKLSIASFLIRVPTLSAQFPRIRTCSHQINLYEGKIAVIYTTISSRLAPAHLLSF